VELGNKSQVELAKCWQKSFYFSTGHSSNSREEKIQEDWCKELTLLTFILPLV
jgi:hypothetical protein